MDRLKKAGVMFDRVTRLSWCLAGGLLLFIMFSVIVDVILRYIFGMSLTWVIEISEYSLFGIAFLGTTWCLRTKGHVRIDFIFNMLRQRVQIFLNLITSALSAIACFVYAFYAGQVAWMSIQRGTHLIKFLKVPKYVFASLMCIYVLLLAIEFLRQTHEHFVMSRGFGLGGQKTDGPR